MNRGSRTEGSVGWVRCRPLFDPDELLGVPGRVARAWWKYGGMAAVTRLVTLVDIGDRAAPAGAVDAAVVDGPAPADAEPGVAPTRPRPYVDDPREMSLSAVHLAVLDDGARLTLLDDRGWGVHGPPDIWRRTSVEEIEATARTVVGPDEPYGSRSQTDMETDHWAYLAAILRHQGVLVDAEELSRLPHHVQLSERLRARLTST